MKDFPLLRGEPFLLSIRDETKEVESKLSKVHAEMSKLHAAKWVDVSLILIPPSLSIILYYPVSNLTVRSTTNPETVTSSPRNKRTRKSLSSHCVKGSKDRGGPRRRFSKKRS